MTIGQANKEAVTRMVEARPVLVALAKAREAIPGMADNLILHAGPPIEWERMSGPLRGAVIGALIFEGRAAGEEEARALVERGEVLFEPCHHHGAVGPMAGVISPSMSVYVLENRDPRQPGLFKPERRVRASFALRRLWRGCAGAAALDGRDPRAHSRPGYRGERRP